jgi:hypothetical protein
MRYNENTQKQQILNNSGGESSSNQDYALLLEATLVDVRTKTVAARYKAVAFFGAVEYKKRNDGVEEPLKTYAPESRQIVRRSLPVTWVG